ncbi:hypothetical protein OIDMADRAFT_146637 [Oidiodendron maius Zn]|uniref:Necrosis inducing protein (NPP1) n=1 Tax=Oidiodendron maius (strain Zn) TaxID=913774 RepID=A0A0C3CIT7_OIDMZ|nr:hypothetical protein OIDMADRAFT_146637 [Oidiodendron maius Zn]
MPKLTSFCATALSLAALAAGANEYSTDQLQNDPLSVAMDAAPMWHFADGSCYPQAAEVNGQQTNGNEAGGDLCVLANLPSGCQDPGPWLGANTQGTDFPTYFTAKYCSGDNTWRISYNLYFRHDSGHESDWEFMVVVLQQDPGNGNWFRDEVIFEQDGSSPHVNWGNLDTFDDVANSGDGQRNLNHAKVYVTKYHHAVWNTQYTGNKDDCLVLNADQFRPNDFYQYSASTLVNGSLIPVDWDWGQAASSPMAMYGDGSQDVCNK